MSHLLEPVLFAVGALILLVASLLYRLPDTMRYAPVGWGLVAALWPSLAPASRFDVWDVGAFLGATALCAVAAAHASRTRAAQLPPGWWTEVERHLGSEHGRE